MKRLLLLTLVAVPLFAAGVHFIYYDYGYDDGGYWYDEYWEDEYWYDGYWVYYPHGYYCIRFVWWYPWWWDWYWGHCHWCHHFDWDFFYHGFYVVWYENGCWWFRPRYGRWVRYRLPYAYHEVRYRAKQHGIYLPAKPPREIIVPYKEHEIMKLARQTDPGLFSRVEKERKSGNLERMKREYTTRVEKEIVRKNQEYGIKNNKMDYTKSIDNNKRSVYTPTKRMDKEEIKKPYTQTEQKSQSHIQKRKKSKSTTGKTYYSGHDDKDRELKKSPDAKKAPINKYDKKEKSTSKNRQGKSPDYQKGKRTSDDRRKMHKSSSKEVR